MNLTQHAEVLRREINYSDFDILRAIIIDQVFIDIYLQHLYSFGCVSYTDKQGYFLAGGTIFNMVPPAKNI